MEQTPKRFYLRSEIIGAIEVLASVLLFLTGYAAGDEKVWYAVGIGASYAACKNFIERCYPKNDVPPKPINPNEEAN